MNDHNQKKMKKIEVGGLIYIYRVFLQIAQFYNF